jgi:release factor glutamine methyltransferase
MPSFNTIKDLLYFGANQLRLNGISNYKKESEWMLLNILKENSSWLIMNRDTIPKDKDISCFIDCINKRSDHIPIQLIMGKATFYGRDFSILPDVFIPRPDSELIIDILKKKAFQQSLI